MEAGQEVPITWRIAASYAAQLDTDHNGAYETSELARLRVDIDLLGGIDNQVSGDGNDFEHFASAEGDLIGYGTITIPIRADLEPTYELQIIVSNGVDQPISLPESLTLATTYEALSGDHDGARAAAAVSPAADIVVMAQASWSNSKPDRLVVQSASIKNFPNEPTFSILVGRAPDFERARVTRAVNRGSMTEWILDTPLKGPSSTFVVGTGWTTVVQLDYVELFAQTRGAREDLTAYAKSLFSRGTSSTSDDNISDNVLRELEIEAARIELQVAKAKDELARGSLHDHPESLPKVLSDAFGGDVKVHMPVRWDPFKPSVVLVHGVGVDRGYMGWLGDTLKSVIQEANVLSVWWGKSGLVNGAGDKKVFGDLLDEHLTPEQWQNLHGALLVNKVLQLLNEVHGANAKDQINVIAHSQGTVVVTAALLLNPTLLPTYRDATEGAPFDINQTLFIGSNLDSRSTQIGRELAAINKDLRTITNLWSIHDKVVDLWIENGVVLGQGAGAEPGFITPLSGVINFDAETLDVGTEFRNVKIRHSDARPDMRSGDISWWTWLTDMQRGKTKFITNGVISSTGFAGIAEPLRKQGSSPIKLIGDKLSAPSASAHDLPPARAGQTFTIKSVSPTLPIFNSVGFGLLGGASPALPVFAQSAALPTFPVSQGSYFYAEAVGAYDPDGRIVQADFYRDINGNGQPDGESEYVGSDLNADNGWRRALYTNDWPLGDVGILAQVWDDGGNASVVRAGTARIVAPGSPPPVLPESISLTSEAGYEIIPHRNGDVSYNPTLYHVGPGHVDFWEIRPSTGGGFNFETTGETDTVLGLYNRATGAILTFDEDNGAGNNAELTVTLDAGVAYVLAVTSQRGSSGNYGLFVSGANQALHDTIATPPPLYKGSTAGAVLTSYDTRYYRVDVPAGATSLDLRLDNSATLDGFLRIEDSSHETIRTSFLSGAGQSEVVSAIPVTPGDIFYVTVTGIAATTGSFTLNVDFNPDDSGLPDELAPVPASPLLVTLPDGTLTLENQTIATDGEFDCYFLSRREGETGEVVIQTFGDLDTQVGVYRRFGAHLAELVAEDDDGGAGANARISADLPAGEVYVIVVRADGGETGTYDLSITGQPVAVTRVSASGRGLSVSTSVDFLTHSHEFSHYSIVAPQGATSLDIASDILPAWPTLDIGLRIVDASGTVLAVLDTAGPGVNEQATLPVVAGDTYYITAWSEDLSVGDYRLHLDFDPDFQTTEGPVFPVNSTSFDDQRSPAVAMNAAGQSIVAWVARTAGTFDTDVYFQQFGANGAAEGPETQANLPDGSVDQGPPIVGIDAAGNFVIAWVTVGEIVLRRFSASGAALGDEIPTALPGISAADIAVQANGAFMIVSSDATTLWGRLFDSSGSPLTSTLVLDYTADEVGDASVAADGAGNYVVAWNVYSDGMLVNDTYAVRLNSAGNPLSSGRHDFVPGEIRGRRFEDVNANGAQDLNESGIAGATVLLDANGNGVEDAGELTQITDGNGDYLFPGVATGLYHVVTLSGPPSGPAVLFDSFDREDSDDLGSPWIEQLGELRIEGNRLRSTGTNGKSRAVYQPFEGAEQAVSFDLDYDTAAGERNVNAQAYLAYADPQHYVSVTFQDNEVDGQSTFSRVFFDFTDTKSLRAWPRMRGGPQFVDVTPFSSARILAAYDPVFTTLTVGIDRDFDGVYETMLTRGGILPDGLGKAVAIGGYNNVAIDHFTIDTNWRVMPSSSEAPTETFRVAPDQTQSQGTPDVAAHPDGTFVVAFEANDTDGTGRNIYVQRFDANGSPSGPLSRANTLTLGDQVEPVVAIVSQGKFLVGWTTIDADVAGTAVQLFGVDGAPIGPEFVLNQYQVDNQQRLALASNGDEQYIGVWESDGQDMSGWGVFGRRFKVDTLLESELTVIDSSGAVQDRLIEFNSAAPAADTQTVVIRNDGNRLLNVYGLEIYGEDSAAYVVNDTSGFILQPGESRVATITFLGTSPGEHFAALRIYHDDDSDSLSGDFDANPYWVSLHAEIADLEAPAVAGVAVSGTSWDIANYPSYFIPVGAGEQLRSLPWWNIDSIRLTFTEDVRLRTDSLEIEGPPSVSSSIVGFSYDSQSRTAAWQLSDPLPTGSYQLRLKSTGLTGVVDLSGDPLDGEWDNPTGLNDTTSDTFPSGDGVPGGDLVFAFTVLPGDANRDGIVSGADYVLWADAFLLPRTPGSSLVLADFNNDGSVDGADYTVWANHLGETVPGLDPPNDVPFLFPIPTHQAREGFPVHVLPQVIDVINEGLVFTLLETPVGVSIDPATGRVSWTPNEEDGGRTFEFVILVSEVALPDHSASQMVTIIVEEWNESPTIDPVADQLVELGEVLSFVVHASDEDLPAQSLTYGLGPSVPSGLIINSVTGRVEWDTNFATLPLGEYLVDITVTDDGTPALANSQSVRITVVDTTPPRIASSAPAPSSSLTVGPDFIVVHFSEPVDVIDSQLSALDLILDGDGLGTAHVTAAEWFDEDTAQFFIAGQWDTGVIVARLRPNRFFDLAGNVMEDTNATTFTISPVTDALVHYSLILSDLNGFVFPRDSLGRYLIPSGVSIQVDVYVNDSRHEPENRGVFAAFVDLHYGDWISFEPAAVEHGPTLNNVTSGQVLNDQRLVDRFGGVGDGVRPPAVNQLVGTLRAQLGTATGEFVLDLSPETTPGYESILNGYFAFPQVSYHDAVVFVSSSPWTNPDNPLDVDADDEITEQDARVVLDYLELLSIGQLPAPTNELHPAPFLDVNRDGLLTPYDAHLIFDHVFAATTRAPLAAVAPRSATESWRRQNASSVVESLEPAAAVDGVFDDWLTDFNDK